MDGCSHTTMEEGIQKKEKGNASGKKASQKNEKSTSAKKMPLKDSMNRSPPHTVSDSSTEEGSPPMKEKLKYSMDADKYYVDRNLGPALAAIATLFHPRVQVSRRDHNIFSPYSYDIFFCVPSLEETVSGML
jgi:hypothetical protein